MQSQPASAAGRVPLDTLDPLLQHRSRLGAMVLLSKIEALSFTALRAGLGETDGNLGAQLRRLEEAGYLAVHKSFRTASPSHGTSWRPPAARGVARASAGDGSADPRRPAVAAAQRRLSPAPSVAYTPPFRFLHAFRSGHATRDFGIGDE